MNTTSMNNISELNNKLNAIYRFEFDPQALADEWRKLDVAILIEWLVMQLQFAIRARFLANATDFTDTPIGTLHNTWRALTLRTLFKQLQAVEELREQLGGGINVDLALRVVLLGFQPDRGRL